MKIQAYKEQIAHLKAADKAADKLRRQAEIDYFKAKKRAQVVEESWTLVISAVLLVVSLCLIVFYK